MKKDKKIKKEKQVKKLITEKLLHDLLEQGKYDEIKKVLIKAEPADVADVFENLTIDEARQLFEILEPDHASEIIIEMDPQEMEDVVDELSPKKLADMIHEMADDDAVDFFAEMEPEEQNAILLHLNDERRFRLKELLDYEEDSAGGLMTLELCSVKATSTVQQVINFETQFPFFCLSKCFRCIEV